VIPRFALQSMLVEELACHVPAPPPTACRFPCNKTIASATLPVWSDLWAMMREKLRIRETRQTSVIRGLGKPFRARASGINPRNRAPKPESHSSDSTKLRQGL